MTTVVFIRQIYVVWPELHLDSHDNWETVSLQADTDVCNGKKYTYPIPFFCMTSLKSLLNVTLLNLSLGVQKQV